LSEKRSNIQTFFYNRSNRMLIALNFPFMQVWPKDIPMWNWNQYRLWPNLRKSPSGNSIVGLTLKDRQIKIEGRLF